MGATKYYDVEFRKMIYKNYIQLGKSVDFILRHCISDSSVRSKKYLHTLCKRLENPQFAENYLLGPKTYNQTGRPRKLDNIQTGIIMDMLHKQKKISHRDLLNKYNLYYYGTLNPDAPHQNISITTIHREIERQGESFKVTEYRNINRDNLEGLAYMEAIMHLNPMKCIDVDETANNRESFIKNKGHSPVGEPCICIQITIDNKSWSTIAAGTPLGFIAYKISSETINENGILEFINVLEERMDIDSFIVLDRAAIHRTDEVKRRFQQISQGRFRYCAAYSPHLKPVELMFKMVKDYIKRRRDEDKIIRPEDLIDEAFRYFSPGGGGCDSVFGCWSLYFKMHAAYNDI